MVVECVQEVCRDLQSGTEHNHHVRKGHLVHCRLGRDGGREEEREGPRDGERKGEREGGREKGRAENKATRSL